jgi:hypothetical protein
MAIHESRIVQKPKKRARIRPLYKRPLVFRKFVSATASGVENSAETLVSRWLFDLAFAAPPQPGLAWSCLLFPLIEPDWQISRIRPSEKTRAIAHGRFAVRCGNWTKPYQECRGSNDPQSERNCPVLAAPVSACINQLTRRRRSKKGPQIRRSRVVIACWRNPAFVLRWSSCGGSMATYLR